MYHVISEKSVLLSKLAPCFAVMGAKMQFINQCQILTGTRLGMQLLSASISLLGSGI